MITRNKNRTSRNRLSRSDKINKRLRGVDKGVGKINPHKSTFIANVITKVPVEINGFLIAKSKTSILFRHKKSAASKKMRISVFNPDDIISLFGDAGETSQIIIPQRKVIATYSGTISFDDFGNLVINDTATDETVTLYHRDGVEYEIFSDEDSQNKNTFRHKDDKPVSGKRRDEEDEDEEEELDEDEEDYEDEEEDFEDEEDYEDEEEDFEDDEDDEEEDFEDDEEEDFEDDEEEDFEDDDDEDHL